jgi:hypothetical protein
MRACMPGFVIPIWSMAKVFTAIECASSTLRLRMPSINNVETMLVQQSAMLALMETEVSGPRLPGPMPFTASYLLVTNQRKTLHHVKTYYVEELDRLLPNHQAVQHGNAQWTTIICEGLTQESYIVKEYPSDQDQDTSDDNNGEKDNVFASSLLVEELSSQASARDILKPQINEVLQFLDTLKSKISIQRTTKVLNDLTNELRLELGRLSILKWNIANCHTVNMNVEENLSKKSRSYASKNCWAIIRNKNKPNISICFVGKS